LMEAKEYNGFSDTSIG